MVIAIAEHGKRAMKKFRGLFWTKPFINDLYENEPPSALRVWKKVIADPRTWNIYAHLTMLPEELKEPFERFIERKHEAYIVLEERVELQDWMFKLNEASPLFHLYYLRGPSTQWRSYAVIDYTNSLVKDPSPEVPYAVYLKNATMAAGDMLDQIMRTLRREDCYLITK